MSRRVCFVINQLGGVGSGGSDRVVSVLANGLAARGWIVDICALTDDDTIGRQLHAGVHPRFLSRIRWNHKVLRIVSRIVRGVRLVAAYRRQHSDAVIVSFIAWVNICSFFGTLGHARTIVLSERTDPALDPRSSLARKVRDYCYARAGRLVFQTPDAMDYFGAQVRSRSSVIGNPVTPNLPRWQFDSSSRTVVAASRLEEQKNIPLLLEAFRDFHSSHPDYQLTIYGEGKRRAAIEATIDSLGISRQVELAGHVSNVHERLAGGAFFVSSSDYEGLPNSLLEAMAMGMPVISTDCPIGGPRMLIADGVNGVLVPTKSIEQLSSAMRKLADDASLAQDLGRRAAVIGTAYDADQIVQQWEDVLLGLQRELGSHD